MTKSLNEDAPVARGASAMSFRPEPTKAPAGGSGVSRPAAATTTNPWTGKPETGHDELLRRAKTMTENDLQSCVENAARYRGWRTYHTHDSRRSQAGFPDLVLIRGTRILWRELKTMTGRLRPEQQAWLDDLDHAGADTGVWRPIDWLNGTIDRELTSSRSTH